MKLKKTLLILLSLMAVTLVSLSSCNSGNGGNMIWDVYPIVVSVTVADKAGNDLLDSAATKTVLKNKISLLFKGKQYPLKSYAEWLKEKHKADGDFHLSAYKPVMQGFLLCNGKNFNTKSNFLSFGEIDGAETLKNEKMVIDWGDGTRDEITLYNHVIEGDKDLKCTRKIWLNGKQLKHNTGSPNFEVKIVK